MYRGVVNKFNRGEYGSKALVRSDVERVKNSCSEMTNFLPERLGSMSYRPGTAYIGAPAGEAYLVPFVYDIDDTALIEFTNNQIRIWDGDALITRPSVATTVSDPDFLLDDASWTDASETGCSAAIGSGVMVLTGNESTKAVAHQLITVGAESGNPHALRVVLADRSNKLELRISESAYDESELFKGVLGPGEHSIYFTPSANFYITLITADRQGTVVDSVSFETASNLVLPTSVATASLPSIRFDQSYDVIFCAYDSGRPFMIKRYDANSWGLETYYGDAEPFEPINNTNITISSNSLEGYAIISASEPLFTSSHINGSMKLGSLGQDVQHDLSSAEAGTNSIRVTGVGDTRKFDISVSGTWVATVTLQVSTDGVSWSDTSTTYTTNTSATYDDSQDNSILYYRLYIKAGDYTSGTVDAELSYEGGSIEGIVRLSLYVDNETMTGGITSPIGSTDATRDWYMGRWNDYEGYPSAVVFYDGRLWFAGKGFVHGSVSDNYYSFDTLIEGASAGIERVIPTASGNVVNWLAASSKLLFGNASAESTVKSSYDDELVTNLNVSIKATSNRGSTTVDCVMVDDNIVFVNTAGTKVYLLEYDNTRRKHVPIDLTLYNPDILSAGVKRLAYSSEPEPRIYIVMDDGTMRVLLLDNYEDVNAWSRIETPASDTIEDVVVLPNSTGDDVYVIVNRTGGRYLEKFALQEDAIGGTLSLHLDSHVTGGPATTTITGLTHLNGETVYVWADGEDKGSYTVSAGSITISGTFTSYVVGLQHTSDYVSNKLNDFVDESVLSEHKRVVDTSLIMENYYPDVVTVGPDTSNLKALPDIENGKAVVADTLFTEYDELPFPFDGNSDTDPRVYVRATGPCTILALTYGVKYSAKGAKNKAG
jgi:hypothetical protein